MDNGMGHALGNYSSQGIIDPMNMFRAENVWAHRRWMLSTTLRSPEEWPVYNTHGAFQFEGEQYGSKRRGMRTFWSIQVVWSRVGRSNISPPWAGSRQHQTADNRVSQTNFGKVYRLAMYIKIWPLQKRLQPSLPVPQLAGG